MARIKVSGEEFNISMVVFDKDGLLFKSQPFWLELATQRLSQLEKILGNEGVDEWAVINGIELYNREIAYVDPLGILALASKEEEMNITGGLLTKYLGLKWPKAREVATGLLKNADENISLEKALIPTEGFPDILIRLRRSGIPYAIATSDIKQRVIDSLTLYGEPAPLIVVPEMVNKGKPFPDMLELISEKSNFPLRKLMMIGDSYVDVQMAKSAGSVAIGIPETDEMRREMQPLADVIVNNLNDITFLKE